jgi:hypothetical protein
MISNHMEAGDFVIISDDSIRPLMLIYKADKTN